MKMTHLQLIERRAEGYQPVSYYGFWLNRLIG